MAIKGAPSTGASFCVCVGDHWHERAPHPTQDAATGSACAHPPASPSVRRPAAQRGVRGRDGRSCGIPEQGRSLRQAADLLSGQEGNFAAKRNNLARSLAAIDRLVVYPRETFSFWHCVGRPTIRAGYQEAAAIRDGALVRDIGGAICLASTLLYNVGLLAGMAIEERWCHSVDSYGDARYFELGRDAAVEYAYRDLRMRNDLAAPLMLRARVCDGAVRAEARAPSPQPLDVNVVVSIEESHATLRATATRIIRFADTWHATDATSSIYARASRAADR